MLVKATLIPEKALTATETGAWYDLAGVSGTAGTVIGATIRCSAFTSGTFDVLVYTSPDQTNSKVLTETAVQVTGTGFQWVNTAYNVAHSGAVLAAEIPDAFRWVRAIATGASTPIATLEVQLWAQHD